MASSQLNCAKTIETYWLLGPVSLFSSPKLIASSDMDIGAKLNAVYRLSLILFSVFILIFDRRIALSFLTLATSLNIIFYLGYKGEYVGS